MSLYMLSN